jgi:hypothetical protein
MRPDKDDRQMSLMSALPDEGWLGGTPVPLGGTLIATMLDGNTADGGVVLRVNSIYHCNLVSTAALGSPSRETSLHDAKRKQAPP